MSYSPEEWRGAASIEPQTPVVAGSHGTWTIRYRTGAAGIDEGGRLRLSWRSVSDWPAPQFNRPEAENYMTVRTSGRATLTPEYGVTGVRPWSKTVTARVSEEGLAPGDEVVIVLGDRSRGGPGMRAQTHPEDPFQFKFDVDPFGTALYEHVADLGFTITGGQATRLYVVAPSEVAAGEEARLQVRALDSWGNPAPGYSGTVRFEGGGIDGLPDSYTFTNEDAGVRWFEGVRFSSEGVERVRIVDDEGAMQAESNPVRVGADTRATRLYWADLHGQTQETVGTGTIPGYFHYARHVAGVDAAAHQGNDFQITPELWDYLCEQVEAHYAPGEFVTLHGWEWSGNTVAGGDHNVYVRQPEPPQRSSHTQIEDKSDIETDRYPITQLYEANRGRDDMLIVPHIGGRRADIQWHEPTLEPVIEIASQWGRFEWFALEALERGYRVGFVGGSDDHSARQGWSAPTLAHHGVQGGLMAFRADELTRDGLWNALKSRHVYGTSGPRIILDVDVNGRPMGSEFETGETPEINVFVAGTAGIDTVELRRSTETVYSVSGLPEPEVEEPLRLRIAWRGARNRGRSRALDWTGELRVWNGAITAAENYAIDSPLDGVQQHEPDRVVWRSHTCGDWDGVILDIEGDDGTRFDFRTPAMACQFTLDEVLSGTIRKVGRYLEQQVVIRRLSHRPGSREVSFSWRDESPAAGVNPYWIWVTQADGELAWSSPVYLSYTGR